MDADSRYSILAIVFLLCLAIYFAAVETAFASASRVKIKTKYERGDKSAKKALFVLDNFDKAITTILIGTNIAHISIGAITTVLVTRHFGVSVVALATIAVAIAVFFVAEMLPKSIARRYSEQICFKTASSLCFFMSILSPASYLVTVTGKAIAGLTKGDAEVSVTEDELYDIIEDMTDEGSLDSVRGELMSSALQFADLTAETVLTARVDAAAIDAAWGVDKILELIKKKKHSRFPVYEGSIDNIIGVLHIRKYIKAYLKIGDQVRIKSLLDEAYFVHRSIKINELLPLMSEKKLNMAIVTDNYGGTLGLVTIEDILEELVGEIWDEDDIVEESFMPIGGGRYEVDAGMTVGEAFDRLGFFATGMTDSLENKLMGEWAYEQFDRIPSERDSFVYEGLEVTVSSMRHNRILKLSLRLLSDEDEDGGEEV